MNEESETQRFGEMIEILTGFPFKSTSYTDDINDTRLLRGDNIGQGQLDWENAKRWPVGESNNLDKYHLLEGDIVLAMDRPWIEAGLKYAVIQKSDLPCLLVQRVARIRPKNEYDSRFITALIDSWDFTHYILNVQTGTAVPHISSRQISEYKVPKVGKTNQKRIAINRGLFDSKISVNKLISETTFEIIEALFRSWFIYFDPVREKSEGVSTYGMNEEIAALFPVSFENSELGPIPVGWKVKKIGDLIERLKVGKKYDQWTVQKKGKVPVLDQGKKGIIGYHNDAPGVTASLERPVVIFCNHTCLMKLISHPFSAIQNVLPFEGKGVNTTWTYFATRGKQEFTGYKGHWPDFIVHKLVVPPEDLTNKFGQVVENLLASIDQTSNEENYCESIRDFLLPRMISGEFSFS